MENRLVNSLMTIGDFSRAVRLTAKALRFYHENDILAPVVVDQFTGYRMYSADQIADAQIVRTLRGLQVPIPFIKEVLTTSDVTRRTQLLAQHLDAMEAKLADTQTAVRTLRSLLAPPPAQTEIEYRSVPAVRTVAIREVIDLPQLAGWFTRSIAELERIASLNEPDSVGHYGGVWPDELISDGRGAAMVYIEVTDLFTHDEAVGDNTAIVELPPVELAVVTHRGSDETVPLAYAALGQHVARAELASGGPIREVYLQGFPTVDPYAVTEIGWPILRVEK